MVNGYVFKHGGVVQFGLTRLSHKQKIVGSNPTSATKREMVTQRNRRIIPGLPWGD